MNKKNSLLAAAMLTLMAIAAASQAFAGVVLDSTRIIYPAKEREVTLKVTNPGKEPAMTQVWIDRGDASQTAGQTDAPFFITPPLSRLEPGRGQAYRIYYVAGENLPQDRESLFFFNLLEVPPIPKDASNYVQMAFRSRIKLFYRPADLPGDAAIAATSLSWRLVKGGESGESGGYAMQASNDSVFHVNVADLVVRIDGKRYSSSGFMVAPGASHDIALTAAQDPGTKTPLQDATVQYTWISDHGGAIKHESPLAH